MGVRKRLIEKELRKSKSADDKFLHEDLIKLQEITCQRNKRNKDTTKLYGDYKKSIAQFSMTFAEYAKKTEAERKFFKTINK